MNDDNDESRRTVEQCYRTRKTLVNPIVDWTDEDVWEYLNEVVKVPHCELYDQGIGRIGCIGCPLQSKRGMREDFKRWPKYRANYVRAFDRMCKVRAENGLGESKFAWKTGEDVMRWWTSENGDIDDDLNMERLI